MAAQSDSLPQGGANPTSAWVAGETVADTLSLQVGADVAPGRYRLLWGMYDQNANRVPLTNADDSMAQDNVFVLGEIEVVAGQ